MQATNDGGSGVLTTGLNLLLKKLAEPFPAADVKFKPQAVRGNRALAIAYVDARLIMDRLDAVLGAESWGDEYTILEGNSVICRLTVHCGSQSVTKCDVGSPSEQPDGGDRLKAAFSDALKRAAIKFGVGRYLYRLPHTWVDFDPQAKKLLVLPQLPAWALPGGSGKSHGERAPANNGQSQAPPPANQGQKPQAISPIQQTELIDKMKRAGGQWEVLFKRYNIKNVAEFPFAEFHGLIAKLDNRLREKGLDPNTQAPAADSPNSYADGEVSY